MSAPRQCGHVEHIGLTALFYDRQGRTVCIECLDRLMSSKDYRVVDYTERGGVAVSTVWLGVDYGLGRSRSEPVIFESMIFGSDRVREQCWRYSTETQARAGHAELCSLVFAEVAQTDTPDPSAEVTS